MRVFLRDHPGRADVRFRCHYVCARTSPREDRLTELKQSHNRKKPIIRNVSYYSKTQIESLPVPPNLLRIVPSRAFSYSFSNLRSTTGFSQGKVQVAACPISNTVCITRFEYEKAQEALLCLDEMVRRPREAKAATAAPSPRRAVARSGSTPRQARSRTCASGSSAAARSRAWRSAPRMRSRPCSRALAWTRAPWRRTRPWRCGGCPATARCPRGGRVHGRAHMVTRWRCGDAGLPKNHLTL